MAGCDDKRRGCLYLGRGRQGDKATANGGELATGDEECLRDRCDFGESTADYMCKQVGEMWVRACIKEMGRSRGTSRLTSAAMRGQLPTAPLFK